MPKKKAEKKVDDFKLRRGALVERAKKALALRATERDFQGLDREFFYLYAELIHRWEKTKDVGHPRDKGSARENIVAGCLAEFLPAKFQVTERSSRVCSIDGFVSREMDILIYDRDENIRLMTRETTYEVYPVETVLGAIQVKSRLNQGEITDALLNIASVRRLYRYNPIRQNPFGIIFAYDTDLEWVDIFNALEAAAKSCDRATLPNAVFILTRGFFVFGNKQGGDIHGKTVMTAADEACPFPMPDWDGQILAHLMFTVLELARAQRAGEVNLRAYQSLPVVSGSRSYRFCYGHHVEMVRCSKHGEYMRRISQAKLEEILAACRGGVPIQLAEEIHRGMGGEPADFQPILGVPDKAHLFNPDQKAACDLVVGTSIRSDGTSYRSLAFDLVECEGMLIVLPEHYQATHALIEGCPSCAAVIRRRTKAAKKVAAAPDGMTHP